MVSEAFGSITSKWCKQRKQASPYLICSKLLYAGWAAAWKESAVVGVGVHMKHEHFNPTEDCEGDD